MPCMYVLKDIYDKNNTDALFVPNASNVSNCKYSKGHMVTKPKHT